MYVLIASKQIMSPYTSLQLCGSLRFPWDQQFPERSVLMFSTTVFHGRVMGQNVSLWSYNGSYEFPVCPQLCEFPVHEYPPGVISVSQSPGSHTVAIRHHAQNGQVKMLYSGLIQQPFAKMDPRAVPIMRELARRDPPSRVQKAIAENLAAFFRNERLAEMGVAA